MRHALVIGIIVALFAIIGTICYDGISCRVFAGQPTEAPLAEGSVLVNTAAPEVVVTAQPVADGACCVRCKAVRCKSVRRCAGACRCQSVERQVVERRVVERPARKPLFASFAERLCAKKRAKSCAPCAPVMDVPVVEAPVVDVPVVEAPVTAAPVTSAPVVKEGCQCRGRCHCKQSVKVNVRVRVR